jgi:hypothetical protein
MAIIRKFPYTFNKVINLKNTDNPVYQNLQIKGIPEVLIYENSSMATREISEKINRFNFFKYIDRYYNDTFISNETTPYLICFCDGSFTNLDEINYDSEIIEYLNKVGLHVYLWELIVYKTQNTKTKKWLIELNHNNIEQVFLDNKDSIYGFETNNSLSNLSVFEFDKLSDFAKRNNLTNLTVFTGNYKLDQLFKYKYKNLKFKVKDVAVCSMFNKSNNKLTAYTYIDNLTSPSENLIEYKFSSLNKRYSPQRNLIAAYLLDKSCLLSYNADTIDFIKGKKSVEIENPEFSFWKDFNKKVWFKFTDWKNAQPLIFNKIQKNMEYLEKVRYLSIDKDIKESWLMYEEDLLPTEYYHSSFCSVVTETVFAQPCGHYADKVLNAIKCFRPFVLVAPPLTLEYLRTSGVKTFSDYWDESYDQETNHEQRLLKILKIIDYIDNKSIDELRDLYNDMRPILDHNYKVIKALKYQN